MAVTTTQLHETINVAYEMERQKGLYIPDEFYNIIPAGNQAVVQVPLITDGGARHRTDTANPSYASETEARTQISSDNPIAADNFLTKQQLNQIDASYAQRKGVAYARALARHRADCRAINVANAAIESPTKVAADDTATDLTKEYESKWFDLISGLQANNVMEDDMVFLMPYTIKNILRQGKLANQDWNRESDIPSSTGEVWRVGVYTILAVNSPIFGTDLSSGVAAPGLNYDAKYRRDFSADEIIMVGYDRTAAHEGVWEAPNAYATEVPANTGTVLGHRGHFGTAASNDKDGSNLFKAFGLVYTADLAPSVT
jgi:hypothetical protein